MNPWVIAASLLVAALLTVIVVVVIAMKRALANSSDFSTEIRAMGEGLVRLPGQLRRVAADPRTPRRARWWLIGLAFYLASPIDLIPDFIPGLGQLDDIAVVLLVLRHVKRMIPDSVWREHFFAPTDTM
jgi:uncharacterized membrane protein YkvA (DUF1232 family)